MDKGSTSRGDDGTSSKLEKGSKNDETSRTAAGRLELAVAARLLAQRMMMQNSSSRRGGQKTPEKLDGRKFLKKVSRPRRQRRIFKGTAGNVFPASNQIAGCL